MKVPRARKVVQQLRALSQRSSQHQYGSCSQPSLALVPGDPSYSTLWSLQVPGTQMAHTITCRENTHRHKINLKFLKIKFMCVFLHICRRTTCMLSAQEVRSWQQILWNWSHRWLCARNWHLGPLSHLFSSSTIFCCFLIFVFLRRGVISEEWPWRPGPDASAFTSRVLGLQSPSSGVYLFIDKVSVHGPGLPALVSQSGLKLIESICLLYL